MVFHFPQFWENKIHFFHVKKGYKNPSSIQIIVLLGSNKPLKKQFFSHFENSDLEKQTRKTTLRQHDQDKITSGVFIPNPVKGKVRPQETCW